jgi:hypothetical protein
MRSSKPRVAIIDWAAAPLGDPEPAAERAVIGDAAEVRRSLCSSDADFTKELCGATALLVWHNAPIGAVRGAPLENVVNGVPPS